MMATTSPSNPVAMQAVSNKRFAFRVNDQTIYEWEQSLDSVTIYVPVPPDIKVRCSIGATRLVVGMKNNAQQDFINEPFPYKVETDESTWTLEEEEQDSKVLCIYLHKANKGIVWEIPLVNQFGVTLNEFDLNRVKQELMLERWQEENPGFDFRDAEFNGSTPDPRTFMNGVNYK